MSCRRARGETVDLQFARHVRRRVDRPETGNDRGMNSRAQVDRPADPAPTLIPPLPDHLQLEITSACNLRCTMCLVRYRPPVNKIAGAMPLSMFDGLIGDLPGLRQLTLQGLGEPLLAPDLLPMIQHAKARGVRVGFN